MSNEQSCPGNKKRDYCMVHGILFTSLLLKLMLFVTLSRLSKIKHALYYIIKMVNQDRVSAVTLSMI